MMSFGAADGQNICQHSGARGTLGVFSMLEVIPKCLVLALVFTFVYLEEVSNDCSKDILKSDDCLM